MPGRSLRIARIAGIPVGASPWWLVIVALITWTLGASYFPSAVHGIDPASSYALGFASALLLFAGILAHEFGHALVARRHGIEVQEIDLWLLGGVSRMREEAHEPQAELHYALAGPAVTAVIAAIFAGVLVTLPASTPAIVRALVEYQVLVNCAILLFNLMPAFPLDGGRVLRSLLWRRSGELSKSTETAANVGRGFGYLLIAVGALELAGGAPEGVWLALIGVFIVVAAEQQASGAQMQAMLGGVPAREVMSTPVLSIPANVSLAQATQDYFLPYRYSAFPVVNDHGRAVGVIGAGQIETLTGRRRTAQLISEVADHDSGLIVGEDEDVASLVARPAFARVGRAVVVDESARPIGLISISDVQRALRASRLGDGAGERGPRATAK